MNVHISHSHTVQCTYMYNMHNVWSGVPRFLQQFGWCARLRLTSPEDMSTFCRILVDFSSSSFSAFHFLWLPQLIADNAALSLVAYAPVTATRSPTYPVTNFDAVPATPIASLHSAFQQFHFTSFYFYWSIRCFFLAHCVLVAILMRYTAEQQRLLYVCISVVLCRSERNSRRANTIGHYLLYVSSYSAATRDDCTDISSCGYEIHLPNNDALWTVQHSFSVSFFFFFSFCSLVNLHWIPDGRRIFRNIDQLMVELTIVVLQRPLINHHSEALSTDFARCDLWYALYSTFQIMDRVNVNWWVMKWQIRMIIIDRRGHSAFLLALMKQMNREDASWPFVDWIYWTQG